MSRAGCVGIEQPEGDIHALDFRNVVLRRKGAGQKPLAAVVFFQRRLGGVFVQHKRQDKLGALHPAELPRNDCGVAAVGAAGRGSGFVADQLRPAGRAGVAAQPGGFVLAPDGVGRGRFFVLCGGFGSGFFLGIQGFDLGGVVAAAAEITHQLAAGAVKVQRTGTRRALIVGKLCCHYASPLFPLVGSCWVSSIIKSLRVWRVSPSASK